ncbi:hypothetical protein BGX38DRAFT_1300597 [Terfezia claveryi]|nr:hypothetical protein BGX38DRAFT_1300597 [Terfezia claveryi]
MSRHERSRGIAIPVSAEVQPGWYLSVISLQTFGNTMGNVGRGVRLQTIRNQAARQAMLQRINDEYFSASNSNNEINSSDRGHTAREKRSVRFELRDQLLPEHRHATITPSRVYEREACDAEHNIPALPMDEAVNKAGQCQPVEFFRHCETENLADDGAGSQALANAPTGDGEKPRDL